MSEAGVKEKSNRHVGLATEHSLPEAFRARSDADAGTVEIKTQGKQAVDIAINSFAAVANALAAFAPDGKPTLEPGHTITISDQFSGKSVTVTAGSLIDVATVMKIFAVQKGKYLPAAPEETVTVSPASVVRIADKGARLRKAEVAGEKAAAASDPQHPPVAEQAASAAKRTRSATKPAAPAAEETAVSKADAESAPVQVRAEQSHAASDTLPRTYEDAAGFRLERKKLSLSKANGKTVDGVAGPKSAFVADGYEVTLDKKGGGRHVGWIIVEGEKSWIVTGFGDIPPSKHANMTAALIRIRVTNLPQVI